MVMTIDEAVTWLNTDDYESKGFADATIVAIDTMRKYQKIEQILKEPCIIPEGCYPMLNEIKRVVKEDGKID